MSGQFIITGGDDGIIKVWNKDNLVLQASLHGHTDMIIDIALSKCNRYMASSSKDGTLIIWDFQNCTIIKRITEDHTSQINRLRFEMIQCNAKQAMKNVNSKYNQFSDTSEITNLGSVAGHSRSVSPSFDQFLVSCSDDGSVIVYDVSSFAKSGIDEYYTRSDNGHLYNVLHRNQAAKSQNILTGLNQDIAIADPDIDCPDDKITRRTRKRKLGQNGGITNQTTANSSSQSQQQDTDFFKVKLQSEDFRAGSRNKHIDSISVSQKGFIAGGTNLGEIYLWKVNFSNIRQRKLDDTFKWVNCFKVHKKANHYLDFNKSGEILFSGSADGTAALWDTSFIDKTSKNIVLEDEDENVFQLKKQSDMQLKDIDISEESNLIYKFQETSIKHILECQIDSTDWSVNGRYAICAMSVKIIKDEEEEKDNKQQAKVRIKVYDTFSRQVINNLDKECGLGRNMLNFTSIVKPHPFNDDILLICFDGGVNLLYDIRQRKILQEIVEYGIYSIDQFTMNNQMDVDFSKDGEYIAFSSVFGTLSLYSVHQHKKSQYLCTRVQQFFPYDNEMHDDNVYESLSFQPQLCGYELNPYEVQPTPPTIGKFKELTQDLTPVEFKKQQIFAREFAFEEERFYQDQLREGMRQGYFDTSVDVHDDQLVPDAQRLFSFGVQADDSDTENRPMRAVDVMNQEMYGDSDMELVGGTRAMRERRSRRLGNNERRLVRMDDFPEDVADSAGDEEFEEEESEENKEDESGEDEMDSVKSEVKYFQHVRERRQGYHARNFGQPERRVQIEDNSQDIGGRLTRNRTQVEESKRNRIYSNSFSNQSHEIMGRTRSGRNTRQRVPIDFQVGDQPQRNLRRRREQIDLLSSEDRSAEDGFSEESQPRRSNRRGIEQSQTTRNRLQRTEDHFIQDGDFLSASEDHEMHFENKGDDEKLEKIITTTDMQKDWALDDSFSQRGSKNKKGCVIFKEGRMPKNSKEKDTVYVIDKSKNQSGQSHFCNFCNRIIEKLQLTGPFVKDPKNEIDSSQISFNGNDLLYFHRECLEFNQFTSYSQEKWTNIEFALKNLVEKKSYTCYRCIKLGATIQCMRCDRSFHGHMCQMLYMMSMAENNSPLTYLCIFCKSEDNYQDNDYELQVFMKKKEVEGIRKKINRDHLLTSTPYVPGQFYLPQIGDDVIYFYQGHESFFQSNNCFFYSGTQKRMSSADLPWMSLPHIKKIPEGQLECEVISVQQRFAPLKSEYLIKKFGDCSYDGVVQIPEIMIYVELRISDETMQDMDRNCRYFFIQLFKSKVEQFLVPKFVFDKKQQIFKNRFNSENMLIGKRFKTTCNHREQQIVEISPLEPDILPISNWLTVKVIDAPTINQRMNRTRGSPQSALIDTTDAERINFWEIIFPEENQAQFNKVLVPCAFEQNETARLLDALKLFFNRKPELCLEFLDRVDEQLAPDYRCFIPSEMWLQLVYQRLQQFFYRSQDHLFNDLELISYCCMTYNGDDSPISIKSQNMVEKLRKDLKNQINQNKEKILVKQKASVIVDKNKSPMNFGFQSESNPLSLRQSPVKDFSMSIGDGGTAIKNILRKTLDDEEYTEKVMLIQKHDGSSVIVIDMKAKQSQEEIIPKKRTPGRLTAKKRVEDSQDVIVSLDTPEAINSTNSNNEIELPAKGGRLKKGGEQILGKRKNEMLEESEGEEFESNAENMNANKGSLKITIPMDEGDMNRYNTRHKRQRID